ncbi:MAG: glycosyltransferase family 61 protein [Crocinitomicaceae bacterium]|nr:glycosyltransferase family 61 protein [Crocinitomicaceae bacterium]
MRSQKPISIKIPENVDAKWRSKYAENAEYTYTIPRVRRLNRVFVSHEGIILKKGRLVNRCAFNIRGKRDTNFRYTFWRKTFEQLLVCRYGKSLPSEKLNSGDYTIVHTKWFNYAFWLNSSIPRLINLADNGMLETTTLLLPEGISNIPFVVDTLSQFNVKTKIIPAGKHLFIKNFILSETREWSTEFSGAEIFQLRAFLIPIAQKEAKNFQPPSDKLYLSRKKRGIRGIANEQELEELLCANGFKTIYFEDYSIWEQIILMNQAKQFISIHGAGCSNVMFMEKDTLFIELINAPYAELEYKFPFWKIASLSEVKYSPVFCQTENENASKKISFGKSNDDSETDYLVNQNIVVDLTKVKKILGSRIEH